MLKVENILRQVNRTLNYVIGSFLGVFLGHFLYRYLDFKNNPGLYEIQSAPWYTSIQVYGVFTAVVLVVAAVVKYLVKRKLEGS